MITLKCSLNKSIISCDVKQPYIVPVGSINKNMLSVDLQGEIDKKVDITSDKLLTDTQKEAIAYLNFDKTNQKISPSFIDTPTLVVDDMQVRSGIQLLEDTAFSGIQSRNKTSGEVTSLETVLTKKVGFTDYATAAKGGVIKLGADAGYTGLQLDDGVLRIIEAEDTEIDRRINQHPITPVNLDYAVRSVRPNVIQNTNSEITLTCAANTIYCLGGDGNVTSMALTLPATGQYGDFVQVDFYSDESSPTNLTITSNAGFTDFTLIPESNYIYSLFFDWGMAYTNSDKPSGWRFSYAEYPWVANP